MIPNRSVFCLSMLKLAALLTGITMLVWPGREVQNGTVLAVLPLVLLGSFQILLTLLQVIMLDPKAPALWGPRISLRSLLCITTAIAGFCGMLTTVMQYGGEMILLVIAGYLVVAGIGTFFLELHMRTNARAGSAFEFIALTLLMPFSGVIVPLVVCGLCVLTTAFFPASLALSAFVEFKIWTEGSKLEAQ